MMRRGEDEVEELNGFISQLAERFDGLEGELKQKTQLLAELQREEESAKAEHAMLLRQLQTHEARLMTEQPSPRKEPEPRAPVPKAKPAPSREPAPVARNDSALDEAEDDLMQMQDRVNQLQSMLAMLGGLAEEEEEVDTRRAPVPRPGGLPSGLPAAPPSAPAPAPAADQADSLSASLAGLGALLGDLKGLQGMPPAPSATAPPRGKGMQAAPKRSAAPPQPVQPGPASAGLVPGMLGASSSTPRSMDGPEGLFNTLGELEEKKRKIEQLAAMLNIKLDG